MESFTRTPANGRGRALHGHSPIELVLSKLPGARQKPGEPSWTARCPAHDDNSPSLSVRVGDGGKVLLKCFAGCGLADICRALELQVADLFPPGDNGHRTNGRTRGRRPLGPIVAVYDYFNADGTLLFQVTRHNPKDFRQRHRDGKGDWVWGHGGAPSVPYRLPELLAADPARVVFVCEGEKDVDNLVERGAVATTNPGGAAKWSKMDPDTVRKALKGHRIAILEDNDESGLRHVADVGDSLQGIAGEVRVLKLPGLSYKGDVSDWLTSGGTVQRLEVLAAAAPLYRPAGGGDDGPIHLSDTGNARRFARDHANALRWCDPWGKWLRWDGRRWQGDQVRGFERLARRTVVRMFREAEQEIARIGKVLEVLANGDVPRG
jgi:putative DNA primase/helicase